jgi:hypothetical protein
MLFAILLVLVPLIAYLTTQLHNPKLILSPDCPDCLTGSASFIDSSLTQENLQLSDGRVFSVLSSAQWDSTRNTVVFVHGFPDNFLSFTHQVWIFQ